MNKQILPQRPTYAVFLLFTILATLFNTGCISFLVTIPLSLLLIYRAGDHIGMNGSEKCKLYLAAFIPFISTLALIYTLARLLKSDSQSFMDEYGLIDTMDCDYDCSDEYEYAYELTINDNESVSKLPEETSSAILKSIALDQSLDDKINELSSDPDFHIFSDNVEKKNIIKYMNFYFSLPFEAGKRKHIFFNVEGTKNPYKEVIFLFDDHKQRVKACPFQRLLSRLEVSCCNSFGDISIDLVNNNRSLLKSLSTSKLEAVRFIANKKIETDLFSQEELNKLQLIIDIFKKHQ